MRRPAPVGRAAVLAAFLLAAVVPPMAGGAVQAAPPRAESVPTGASKYVPVPPDRIADTRSNTPKSATPYGFVRLNAQMIRVTVAGMSGVPGNASAVVLNVGVVNNTSPGYVGVYPAPATVADYTSTSNLNLDQPNRVVANLVTVKLGSGGAVDIYHSAPHHIFVDVVGAYVPVDAPVVDGRFVSRPGGPHRAMDTRGSPPVQPPKPAGTTTTVSLIASGVPADASAVVVTLTAVDGNAGFWSAYPAAVPWPGTSSLNLDRSPQTRAAQAIVPLTAGQRAINVYNDAAGHFIVDVAGWFTGADSGGASTDGLFVPTQPRRQLDTRRSVPSNPNLAIDPNLIAPYNNSAFEFATGRGAQDVQAIAMNVTATQPWGPGYVTAYAAGTVNPAPNAFAFSNLNLTDINQTVPNHAIVGVSGRGAAIYTSGGAHLIADVAGWFLGTPTGSPFLVPTNIPRVPNASRYIYAPQLNKPLLEVRTGSNLDAIADKGYAAAFSGHMNVGQRLNVMLFAHRTKSSAGAPWFNLQVMKPGQWFTIVGSDGNNYNYVVVRLDIVKPYFSTINNIGLSVGPATAQLIACDPPGSVTNRIVATGRLVSVNRP